MKEATELLGIDRTSSNDLERAGAIMLGPYLRGAYAGGDVTNLQTRHHIFNSLYEKYKLMDADALNIQYNALSQLQQLLGEIRQTASSSGITNLPAGVNANHVTVAAQLTGACIHLSR